MKKNTKKIRLIGQITILVLGILVWQYPEKLPFITSTSVGYIFVIFIFGLAFYGLPGTRFKKSKDVN